MLVLLLLAPRVNEKRRGRWSRFAFVTPTLLARLGRAASAASDACVVRALQVSNFLRRYTARSR